VRRIGFALLLTPLALTAWADADPLARPAEMAALATQAPVLTLARAANGVLAAGARGHLLRSTDGQQWTQLSSPLRVLYTRLRFRDAQHGCVFGHDAAIVCSRDGGASWTQRHYAPSAARPPVIFDAQPLGARDWLAVGGFGLMLKSTDDGASWQRAENSLTALGYHFNALHQLADGTLVIAGERGLLAVSRDSGAHWALAASPYSGSFFGIQPLPGGGVLLFGQRGRVYAVDSLQKLKPGNPEALDPLSSTGLNDAQAATLGYRRLEPVSTDSLFAGAALNGGGWLLAGAEGAVVRVDARARELKLASREAATTFSAVLEDGDGVLLAGSHGVQRMTGTP